MISQQISLMRFQPAITLLTNMKKLRFILLLLVASGRCDDVIEDFIECIHEITSNNLGVLDENLKGNVDKLKNSYVSETKEHIDLLLAQFVDAYGEVQADLQDLAKQTVLDVTSSLDAALNANDEHKFGVNASLVAKAEEDGAAEIAAGIGEERRGLVLNFKASIRNMVYKVMNEPLVKTPEVFKNFLESLEGIQTYDVNVAPPKKSRPTYDHVPENFHGYAKMPSGQPVLVVQEIKTGQENCHADYLLFYEESVHDLLSEDMNIFVNRYGHLASAPEKIKVYKETLLSELKMYTDECMEKLSKCEELIAAIKVIYDNIEMNLEQMIKDAAEKY